MSAAVVSPLNSPARLLGGHVLRRAGPRPGLGHLAAGVHALGQAEVGDMGLAVTIDQDVLGLQVAMQHAALMGMVHGAGNRRQQAGRGAGVFPESGQFSLRLRPSISFMLRKCWPSCWPIS